MRKNIILAGLVCALLIGGEIFAYTVKGKVHQKGTTIGVSNASVSLTAKVGGSTYTNNAVTASDGSFSIPLNGVNCKGGNMTLKATTTTFQAGSRNWWAQSESETRNIPVVFVLNLNPNISWTAEPIPFQTVGQIQSIPVRAFTDDMVGPPVMVQGFNVNVAFNPNVFNAVNVVPGLMFPEITSVIDNEAGTVNVQGNIPEPVELPRGDFAVDSFFDIFYELEIPAQGEEGLIEILPGSVLLDSTGVEINPVPNDSISKLGASVEPVVNVHIDSFEQWSDILLSPGTGLNVRPMFEVEWDEYMIQWDTGEIEGELYPDTTFMPAELYVYDDNGESGDLPAEGDGLIMTWGEEDRPDGNYASAWVLDYGVDPDLTNCTIQVTVMPPSACNINAVSFAMVDINGLRRSWWWAVPAAIPYNVPTTVTINTSIAGLNAATPVATGYMNTPGFDITKVQSFDVDENANWIFGTQPVPPFNTSIFGVNWNYWHNLIVRKNTDTKAYKGIYVKYSQPVVEIDNPDGLPLINGWDEVSVLDWLTGNNLPFAQNLYDPPRIMADDWECKDERPVTDIHWWGSFLGWTQPTMPVW